MCEVCSECSAEKGKVYRLPNKKRRDLGLISTRLMQPREKEEVLITIVIEIIRHTTSRRGSGALVYFGRFNILHYAYFLGRIEDLSHLPDTVLNVVVLISFRLSDCEKRAAGDLLVRRLPEYFANLLRFKAEPRGYSALARSILVPQPISRDQVLWLADEAACMSHRASYGTS